MHELSIAISIVDRVTEEMEQQVSRRVTAVHLRLGPLSGLDRDALTFSYAAACEGTRLAGSRLIIELVPVVVHCSACRAEFCPLGFQQLACPACSGATTVLSGRELELSAVEVAA